MQYVGFTDILNRWVYTRNGLANLMKKEDFPEPAFTLNNGRARVWDLEDILEFEETHPEVLDNEVKKHKVAAYAICNLKKRRGEFSR